MLSFCKQLKPNKYYINSHTLLSHFRPFYHVIRLAWHFSPVNTCLDKLTHLKMKQRKKATLGTYRYRLSLSGKRLCRAEYAGEVKSNILWLNGQSVYLCLYTPKFERRLLPGSQQNNCAGGSQPIAWRDLDHVTSWSRASCNWVNAPDAAFKSSTLARKYESSYVNGGIS